MNSRHPVWARIAEIANAASNWPMAPEEWERQAAAKRAQGPLGFIEGGAGCLSTVRENREALERWRLVPRILGSAIERDISVRICGTASPVPFFLAPIGVETIAHDEGELAVARAAEACGVPFVVATPSSFTMEEIAREMPKTPRWFQLYFVNDREIVQNFIRRAEASGYSAIVVTLDTPMLGWRERDLGNQRYLPFHTGAGLANFVTDPVFRARLGCDPHGDLQRTVAAFLELFNSPKNFDLSWDDMRWLRGITKLPLLAKGVLAAADARRAFDEGFDGVIVSNHGGRQVDGAIGAIDALVDIRAALGRAPVVMMDGGIRRGSDVIKAIALGADAVLLGRPYIHGLAVGGREGVEAVLLNLMADTDRTFGLCGQKALSELDASAVARRN